MTAQKPRIASVLSLRKPLSRYSTEGERPNHRDTWSPLCLGGFVFDVRAMFVEKDVF